MNNTEVKVSVAYIRRLKEYTERIKDTAPHSEEHRLCVIALLGYLDALETLIPQDDE